MDRLRAAGLSLEPAEEHLRAGKVEVNGELVTDLYRAAPPPTCAGRRVTSRLSAAPTA